MPRLPACLTVALALPAVVVGQREGSTLVGHVIDRNTREPISHAQVAIVATDRAGPTNAQGRFSYERLGAGVYLVHIRALGYLEAHWTVTLPADSTYEHRFEMTPVGVRLGEVNVEGSTPDRNRVADFETRRKRKLGHFITREEIEQRNPATLADLLRTVRGVQAICNGATCAIHMVRAPRGCEPQYYVDGRETSTFSAVATPVLDIYGIEVYRGPGEVPAELMTNAGCGVVSIWTKSAP